jgi:hypothetical protein
MVSLMIGERVERILLDNEYVELVLRLDRKKKTIRRK